MKMPPITKIAALIAPFQNVPLRRGDLDQTDPYDQSFAYHLWRLWLTWLPGPDETPLAMADKWHLQRHPNGVVAILMHDGPVDNMEQMGPDIPVNGRPYDPWATRWCVVGWAKTGSEAWNPDLQDRPHTTWAEAIEEILLAWADRYGEEYGPYVQRVSAIIDGMPCGLLDV